MNSFQKIHSVNHHWENTKSSIYVATASGQYRFYDSYIDYLEDMQ